MHQPDLLVLDEPMNGLDPMGRQEIATILKELAAQGVHILISSHILAELEPLCRNIMILNWGRVMATGARQHIRSGLTDWPEQLTVLCEDPEGLAALLFEGGYLVGFDAHQEEGRLTFRIKNLKAFFRNGHRSCEKAVRPSMKFAKGTDPSKPFSTRSLTHEGRERFSTRPAHASCHTAPGIWQSLAGLWCLTWRSQLSQRKSLAILLHVLGLPLGLPQGFFLSIHGRMDALYDRPLYFPRPSPVLPA